MAPALLLLRMLLRMPQLLLLLLQRASS